MITEERKQKYKDYLKSKEWLELKIYLVEIRGQKCEKCNTSKKHIGGLHLHHITYDRLFNELPSDLMLLCPYCHQVEHGLVKKTKAKKKLPSKIKVRKEQKVVSKQDKYRDKIKELNKSLARIERRNSTGYYSSEYAYKEASHRVKTHLKLFTKLLAA